MEDLTLYPTTPDSDGWYYESKDDETFEVLTKSYDNGNVIKKFALKKGKYKGKEITVRELMGKDMDGIEKMIRGEKESERDGLYMKVAMFKASNINELGLTIEDVENLHAVDYNRLKITNATLNFM